MDKQFSIFSFLPKFKLLLANFIILLSQQSYGVKSVLKFCDIAIAGISILPLFASINLRQRT